MPLPAPPPWPAVAPRVGAWIEMSRSYWGRASKTSRPVWARGLKLADRRGRAGGLESRPVWARGLKYEPVETCRPTMPSRPTRARGLKWSAVYAVRVGCRVAPHAGAWIEMPKTQSASRAWSVAPHAGAWIEMQAHRHAADHPQSRPTRARGLKLRQEGRQRGTRCVAPHTGRVDCNLKYTDKKTLRTCRAPRGRDTQISATLKKARNTSFCKPPVRRAWSRMRERIFCALSPEE